MTGGTSYSFQVRAQTDAGGWGPASAAFGTVAVPAIAALGPAVPSNNVNLVSVGQPSFLSSLYDPTLYLAAACNNNNVGDFCSSNSGGTIDPQGGKHSRTKPAHRPPPPSPNSLPP